jgi:LacI family gluconate utilization system Gnt-I transcriptional repressor
MGKSKVTLKDVSKAAGLSLITVSRALRQPETVHPDTREKVRRTIEDIGYVPNLVARALVSQKSDMVGVVVPVLHSSLFADFTQGAANVLRSHGLQMLLGVSDRATNHEEEAVRTFIARQADAIIVTGFTHTDACRKMLTNFGGPVVETWNLRDEAVDIVVGYDNFLAAADMTRYLINKGYQEIVMVGGTFDNNDQATDRHDGFIAAMREAGREVKPDSIVAVPNPTTIESGADLIMSLLARPVKPDAVFIQAELPAQGAMLACLSQGIRIPEDIAIASFGDLNLSALLPVPLTTIKVRSSEIGKRTADMVIKRLRGEPIEQTSQDVGYDLVIRKSA